MIESDTWLQGGGRSLNHADVKPAGREWADTTA